MRLPVARIERRGGQEGRGGCRRGSTGEAGEALGGLLYCCSGAGGGEGENTLLASGRGRSPASCGSQSDLVDLHAHRYTGAEVPGGLIAGYRVQTRRTTLGLLFRTAADDGDGSMNRVDVA